MSVHGRVFFNKSIRGRHIGFWLIVVVVRNEILHRIVGKKGFHFAVQLSRQCLIRRKYNGGTLRGGNHIR
ncbi:Uncharacterised protein [Vibrio cholerae]|nr:Uncharacterised protein [Vibrio cholerae]CSC34016.1 Uncharacterised protein [Vibrio cholerae]CSI62311.1 Uncharacterised protein [Vibrio cholerae]CSI77629.1 Uncharacterised protein [Vibrio cholerae]